MLPQAAIIVPTRGRPHYLDRALASIAPQAAVLGVEVIVVDDGPEISTRTVAEAHGASYL
ncbi:MAG: glycosyltransferase, partial [Solirubrobacteraceae bacterium]|nr:glycosyltransferase [Solirubrobacteraceae bacterium]